MPVLSRALPLLVCILSPAPAFGAEPDPSVYVEAFSETCRRGFPDIEAIARYATAHGWTERSMRPIGPIPRSLPELPRAFGKGELTLFLIKPATGQFQTDCQVAGQAGTKLSGRDIAAVLTPNLNAGEPMQGKGNPKEDDQALWTISPGFTVQAGINVYQRKARSVSIAFRQAR